MSVFLPDCYAFQKGLQNIQRNKKRQNKQKSACNVDCGKGENDSNNKNTTNQQYETQKYLFKDSHLGHYFSNPPELRLYLIPKVSLSKEKLRTLETWNYQENKLREQYAKMDPSVFCIILLFVSCPF